MADVRDTVAAQLEQVRNVMVELFEDSDQISAMFKKNSKNIKNLSRYLYRIPLMLYRGGNFHKYSANEGPLGKGTGMKLSSLQAGFIYSIRMYRVSDEQVDLSKNTKQSVVDVLATTLAGAATEAQCDDDISLHGDGTGKLTNSSSAVTSTTMTFNDATDKLGIARLREGMTVDVWDSTGATKRALTTPTDGPLTIIAIDDNSKQVTFNTAVTGIVAGDLLAFPDMEEYGPSSLTTFSSGWPASNALTTQGGLTGDSWRHGIYYAHDATSSNYYLGKQKSTIPQLIPTRINGAAQPLTYAHGLLGLDKLRRRRNQDASKGMVGIFPMAQRAQLFEVGTTILNRDVNGANPGKNPDLMFTNHDYTATFEYCGMTCWVSKRQFNDRVDFCNLKNWGRAEVFPIRPYEKGGRTVFEGRDGDGGLVAYQEFGWHTAYDFVCFDPGAEFYIDNLEVPSGY